MYKLFLFIFYLFKTSLTSLVPKMKFCGVPFCENFRSEIISATPEP